MFRKNIILNHLAVVIGLFLLITSFVSAQNSTPTNEQIIAKADEYMNAAVKVDGFSGSVLIARDGKPIFNKGYGMANIELDVLNSPNTVFRLGSITKQFTGMAITMLQERGKLSVNDPLCKYVADCPAAWKPITVKNLLTHTSGIPSYTGFPDFGKTSIIPITTAEMNDLLKTKPLDFTPDEKFLYSNSGYFLLGEIIEKASGKTYADFLQENIFTPLGMKATGYDNPLQIIKNRATGYSRQGGEIFNASYIDTSVPYAAGSLYSTTGDLLIWDQALYTEKLIKRKSLDEMFTPYKSGYGYGWGIGKQFDRNSVSHGGSINGFATDILRFPDDKVTAIVLTNIEGSQAGKVSKDMAAILLGEKYEIPKERRVIALDTKFLEKYVGEYKIEQPSVVITITLEDGKLLGQVASQPKFALSPETETNFFSKDTNLNITFAKDESGQVTGLTLGQGGGGYSAKKVK